MRLLLKDKKDDHVTLKIPQELITEIDKLVGTRGYRSRAEIAKQAIREYIDKQKITQPNQPRFEHYNIDNNSVKIADRAEKE